MTTELGQTDHRTTTTAVGTADLDALGFDEVMTDAPEPRYAADAQGAPGSIQSGIEHSRPLTAAEERTLARRMRQGDKEARDRFIEANLRLVAKICHRFRGGALPIEDLLMEGTFGLIEAADRFNPAQGLRFSTCAVPWIAGRLRRALQKRHLVYIPQRVASTMYRIESVEDLLAQQLGHQPSDEDMAEVLETDAEEVRLLRSLSHGPVPVNGSFDGADAEISIEDTISDDSLPDLDQVAEAGLARYYLDQSLREMDARDQEIVLAWVGLKGGRPHSYAEIARHAGLTRTRVKQICDATVARARERALALDSSDKPRRRRTRRRALPA